MYVIDMDYLKNLNHQAIWDLLEHVEIDDKVYKALPKDQKKLWEKGRSEKDDKDGDENAKSLLVSGKYTHEIPESGRFFPKKDKRNFFMKFKIDKKDKITLKSSALMDLIDLLGNNETSDVKTEVSNLDDDNLIMIHSVSSSPFDFNGGDFRLASDGE